MTRRPRILFGGSFDPPQRAHRRAAEIALRAQPAAELVVVPAGRSPHKRRHEAGPEHRLAMAELAFAGIGRVSAEELHRPGPSYTVDTVTAHRLELGPGVPLFWLLGSDALAGFPTWREPQRILELARILIVPRPGHDPRAILEDAAFPPEIRGRLAAGILPEEAPAVSSTEVRRRLRAGLPVGELLDPAVLAYIERHGLYRGS